MNKIIKNKFSSLLFLLLIPVHILLFIIYLIRSETFYLYIWLYLPFFSIIGIIIAFIQIYKKVDKTMPIIAATLMLLWVLFWGILHILVERYGDVIAIF